MRVYYSNENMLAGYSNDKHQFPFIFKETVVDIKTGENDVIFTTLKSSLDYSLRFVKNQSLILQSK